MIDQLTLLAELKKLGVRKVSLHRGHVTSVSFFEPQAHMTTSQKAREMIAELQEAGIVDEDDPVMQEVAQDIEAAANEIDADGQAPKDKSKPLAYRSS